MNTKVNSKKIGLENSTIMTTSLVCHANTAPPPDTGPRRGGRAGIIAQKNPQGDVRVRLLLLALLVVACQPPSPPEPAPLGELTLGTILAGEEVPQGEPRVVRVQLEGGGEVEVRSLYVVLAAVELHACWGAAQGASSAAGRWGWVGVGEARGHVPSSGTRLGVPLVLDVLGPVGRARIGGEVRPPMLAAGYCEAVAVLAPADEDAMNPTGLPPEAILGKSLVARGRWRPRPEAAWREVELSSSARRLARVPLGDDRLRFERPGQGRLLLLEVDSGPALIEGLRPGEVEGGEGDRVLEAVAAGDQALPQPGGRSAMSGDEVMPAAPDSFVALVPVGWEDDEEACRTLEALHVDHWQQQAHWEMGPDGRGGVREEGEQGPIWMAREAAIPELVNASRFGPVPFGVEELVRLEGHRGVWRLQLGSQGRGRRAARAMARALGTLAEAGCPGALIPMIRQLHSPRAIKVETADPGSPVSLVRLFVGAWDNGQWMVTRGLTAFGFPELETPIDEGLNAAYFRLMDVAANMILLGSPFDEGQSLQLGSAAVYRVAPGGRGPEDEAVAIAGAFGRLAIVRP